jgi:hypothetical protein
MLSKMGSVIEEKAVVSHTKALQEKAATERAAKPEKAVKAGREKATRVRRLLSILGNDRASPS